MANIDLTKYGIKGVKEILYNPTYEVLYNEETKPGLEGYDKGQVTELGAINVMTGIYTGRSPKDKYIVYDKTPAGCLYAFPSVRKGQRCLEFIFVRGHRSCAAFPGNHALRLLHGNPCPHCSRGELERKLGTQLKLPAYHQLFSGGKQHVRLRCPECSGLQSQRPQLDGTFRPVPEKTVLQGAGGIFRCAQHHCALAPF